MQHGKIQHLKKKSNMELMQLDQRATKKECNTKIVQHEKSPTWKEWNMEKKVHKASAQECING